MISNSHNSVGNDVRLNKKHGNARTSRTIRFSDPEWEQVEIAASRCGSSPAEFVRNAALAAAERDAGSEPAGLPPGIVALIESTYRAVYLLATLKRDEMFREGRRDEIHKTLENAKRSLSDLTSGH